MPPAPNSTTSEATALTVKRWLPWVVATALFMEQLDSTIVNTAIPSMAVSLRVAPLSLKAVVTSYILSLAVGIPVSGWIADRYGTRRVFAVAVALFTFASVLCGLSVNVPMLVAARLLRPARPRAVVAARRGGADPRRGRAQAEVGHPRLPHRRAQPSRHVRPEAGRARRRSAASSSRSPPRCRASTSASTCRAWPPGPTSTPWSARCRTARTTTSSPRTTS